ncbi:MAG TPA: dienelactone hydrolase family protein [Pseudonocardia sp.]|jgi:carboxymethylenebutenolidase|nr:dienelactone hydrolase family protein [Pseudonocardia sp.]
MGLIELDTPGGPMEALLTTPATGTGPWPGVVLVHDVVGFTQDVKNISRRVADAGYLVVTPNLYSRGGGARCVTKVMRALMSQKGEAFEDIRTAKTHLEGLDECAGPIGIAGFCMGGQFAIVMAADGFKASAPFYGVPAPRGLDTLLAGACPMVASFGSRDPLGAGSPARLRKALEANGVEHDVKVYEGVGHSFANKLPAQPIQRIVGFGYDEAATDDAWKRVFAFFAKHLV